MAKYIGTYATSGDVQTALDNQELSRPFIAYTTDNKDVIFGSAADKAEVGDIVVYSTGDTLLHYIKKANYSASTYPVADYVPVGVVAYPQNDDAILGPTGEITFMGLNCLDQKNPDTGVAQAGHAAWGYNNFDVPGLTNYANSGTAITDMNGKANTQAVLQYATAQIDWRTAPNISWTNAEGYYPLFECAWRYHTSGTAQGDWYIPAAGQIVFIMNNINMFNELLTMLNGVPFSAYANGMGLSTELSKADAYRFYNGAIASRTKNYGPEYGGGSFCGRPFCSKLMTRI